MKTSTCLLQCHIILPKITTSAFYEKNLVRNATAWNRFDIRKILVANNAIESVYGFISSWLTRHAYIFLVVLHITISNRGVEVSQTNDSKKHQIVLISCNYVLRGENGLSN